MKKNNSASFSKIPVLLYDSFVITILMFTTITVKHSIELADGLWFQGDYTYGFPLPYIWQGINSLSIQIVASHMVIDFLIYFVSLLIFILILRQVFRNNLKHIPRKIIRIIRVFLCLYACGAVIGSFFFVDPLLDLTWFHDLFNDRIIGTNLHFGFYPW